MANILVIDDDDLMRATLRYLLEPAGYSVLEASDGKEGVEIYNKKAADLIITDVMMPGNSGIEVLEKLRRDNPDVKIIVISGGSRDDAADMLRMAKILGATKTFHKPIDKQDILKAVQEALS